MVWGNASMRLSPFHGLPKLWSRLEVAILTLLYFTPSQELKLGEEGALAAREPFLWDDNKVAHSGSFLTWQMGYPERDLGAGAERAGAGLYSFTCVSSRHSPKHVTLLKLRMELKFFLPHFFNSYFYAIIFKKLWAAISLKQLELFDLISKLTRPILGHYQSYKEALQNLVLDSLQEKRNILIIRFVKKYTKRKRAKDIFETTTKEHKMPLRYKKI